MTADEALAVRIATLEHEVESLRRDRHDTLGRLAAIEVLIKEASRERTEDREEILERVSEEHTKLRDMIEQRDALGRTVIYWLIAIAAVLVAVFH